MGESSALIKTGLRKVQVTYEYPVYVFYELFAFHAIWFSPIYNDKQYSAHLSRIKYITVPVDVRVRLEPRARVLMVNKRKTQIFNEFTVNYIGIIIRVIWSLYLIKFGTTVQQYSYY